MKRKRSMVGIGLEEMRLRIGADRMGVSVYACAALNEEGR